jgi:enoyl-CoA hydratase/carnithine racemase
MEYRHLLVGRDGAVGILTLNRGERRNALSLALMRELIAGLEEFGRDGDLKAVILAAAGTAYCSGHDLKELRAGDEEFHRETFATCVRLMETIQEIPQPVIAQVQGIATAAGCQLVATCDVAIASEEASFATPGVRIGLFCSTPMVALTRAIGRKRAMEMLLTGRGVSAKEAAEWGLVNRAVPAAELEAETRALAGRIAEASRYTIRTGKRAFYLQIELDQHRAYEYTSEVMRQNAQAPDAHEGIGAFLGKRDPCWSGR